MHPNNLGNSICESDSSQADESTQTEDFLIIRGSLRLPVPPVQDCNDRSDTESVKIFEFCHILQDPSDPDSVTIFKEVLTKETKSPSNSESIDSESKRYKYCREVIRPYLKSGPDCPETEEDFPDYQSAQGPLTLFSNTNMASNNGKECLPTCSPSEKEASKCPKSPEGCKVPEQEKTKPRCPKKSDKPKCAKKKSADGGNSSKKGSSKHSLSSCEQAPACDKVQIITIKTGPDGRQTYSLTEKCKFAEDNTASVSLGKYLVDSHNETMATIKVAMEDVACKLYEQSQDAINMITNEGAKQLEKIKKCESTNSSFLNKDKNNKCSESITGFNIFRRNDSTEDQEKDNAITLGANANEVIETIMCKVDSTLTMVSDELSKSIENLSEYLKTNRYENTNSKYDDTKPPKQVTHTFVPQTTTTAPSVFSTIKNKICSIFSEVDPKIKNVSSQHSNESTSDEEEDDEHHLDRMVE